MRSHFLPEHYHYSGLVEHKHCLGSLVIQNECTYENQQVKCKEKGRSSDSTLCDDYFFNHEENQSPKFIGDSQPSFRWEPNYESFVVHISTYKNFVGQSSGDSLAFFRCLRLISPCMAVTMNCPVLSPATFTASIASTTLCGARACTFCDLLFTWSLSISGFLCSKWNPAYMKKVIKKILNLIPVGGYTGFQLMAMKLIKLTKPSSVTSTGRASNQTVSKDNDMACLHDTQTRPEKTYLWRFLALNRSDMGAKPCRISVEAPTEHDACRVLAPFFILSLSARLSAQGVCNV